LSLTVLDFERQLDRIEIRPHASIGAQRTIDGTSHAFCETSADLLSDDLSRARLPTRPRPTLT
jgi:hypothetical protein